MPTGQVLRWQTRIITQPITTSGAVAKPNSSAPSSAATTTSRPVFIWPSTCTTMRSRRLVHQQHLLRLGEAELPRHAGVLEAGERRRAGAAVVTGDQHDVGVRLRHPGGDGADARLGDQLHVHARRRIGVLQVEDQLREIFDRVDVVMRRRRDQADAGRRVAHLRDPRIDLVAGQLPALAGLGALRHLDLQVVGVDQVFAGDAEAARRHLLDRAAPRVAVGIGHVARRILAALAGVRLGAHPVHRDGQRLVRFLADRSVRHRAGREARQDRLDRLDFVERNRRTERLQAEQAAQRRALLALVVDQPRVFLEDACTGRCASRAAA